MQLTDLERNEIQNLLYGYNCDYIPQLKEATNKIFDYVQKLISVQWRDAKNDPPELSTTLEFNIVLVVHNNKVKFGWKTSIGWRIEGSPSLWDEEIKYWMPLPKLPE